MKKLKRAPPYDDDPGCKYIVIEDPWPGNAIGKDRNQTYWNHLCTWVRFMLNKEYEVECVFSVNTRNEVIVQIPQDVDMVPILGAHPWRRFLSRGDPRDKDRVSYVFAYDYRNKGEPGNHNWLETYATVSGDPPAYLNFPVIFPYPRPSWASPKGKNCSDIVLPLPPTRQPTPVPDTSLFTPYQHPPQLSANTVNNASASSEQSQQRQQLTSSTPDTVNPHEDTKASRALRGEMEDVKPRLKQELSDLARVKSETVKHEEQPYGPSKTFRSAIEQYRQARTSASSGLSVSASPEESKANSMKPEEPEPPRAPSDSFIAAFNRVRGTQPSEAAKHDARPLKREAEAVPYEPSDGFAAAIQRLRASQDAAGNYPSKDVNENGVVKQESRSGEISRNPAVTKDPRVMHDPDARESGRKDGTSTDPRQGGQAPAKRVKDEDRREPAKRVRY